MAAHASSQPHDLQAIRVALVGPLPPPSGGMANQTRQLARLLAESGITVELVQVNAPYRPAWLGRVPFVRAMARLLPYAVNLWRTFAKVDLVHVMANSGWAWHLFAAPAIWLASLRQVAVIVNYRGGEAASFFDRQIKWVRPSLQRADCVVVPSRFLLEIFQRWNFAAIIVPNIIDLSRFRPRLNPPAAPHIVVTRNLEDIYDIPTAVQAFAIVKRTYPNARLTVAGSGPRLQALKDLCAELGLDDSVRFTGRLDNDEIAALYATATLMLNSSIADNMPISVLESLASGVPVVSTAVGGIPYLVKDEVTALLVPPRNPSAMASAALRLISEPHLAARLSDAGLADVRQYAWGNVSAKLFDVYRAIAMKRTSMKARRPI